MATEQAAPAATSSSVQETATVTNTPTEQTPEEKVPKHAYERAMNDLHSHKKKAQELEERLKTMELDSMKRNQDWQKIAELKEAEARQATEERERLRQSLVFDKKYSAVRESAIKAGLRKEALSDLDMLPLEDVQIETTSTGRINVLGAEDYVSRLKMTRPHWFGGNAPNLNTNSPEVVSSSGVSYEDVEKARQEWKKTGDSATYEKLLRQFKQQSRK